MTENLNESFFKLMKQKQDKIDRRIKTSIRDIGEAGEHKFICEAFIYFQQSNSPEKYFIFERLVRESIIGFSSEKKLKKGDVEYRISYYIVSRKPNAKTFGKWVFGQFCPMIPAEDFEGLIKKARQENIII